MSDHHRSLALALVWRTWRARPVSMLLVPIAVGILAASTVAFALHWPGILTSSTESSISRSAELFFPGQSSTEAMGLAALQVESPYLLGLFAALAGASIAHGAVAIETARGGFDILLASRRNPTEIGLAVLSASVALTMASWLTMVVVVGLLGSLVLLVSGVTPVVSAGLLTSALFISLAMGLTSALITLLANALFPSLSEPRVGMSRSVTQIAGIAPALALLLVHTAQPTLHSIWLGLGVLAVDLVAITVVSRRLGVWLRRSIISVE